MNTGWISACIFATLASANTVDSIAPTTPEALLREAVANQYQGDYACPVVWVENSFERGTDSLHGRVEFGDSVGVRSLRLENRKEGFEWWSRDFGQEQWWKNAVTDRLHRVPFHSFKKPAFGTLFTYEDLSKFPAGFLQDPQACQNLRETDSTYLLSVLLKPSEQSRYGYLDVTLGKKPVLLRQVVFFSPDGKRLKSLEAENYRSEGSQFVPGAIQVEEGDSLASVRVTLGPLQAAPELAGAAQPSATFARISSVTSHAAAPSTAEAAVETETATPN